MIRRSMKYSSLIHIWIFAIGYRDNQWHISNSIKCWNLIHIWIKVIHQVDDQYEYYHTVKYSRSDSHLNHCNTLQRWSVRVIPHHQIFKVWFTSESLPYTTEIISGTYLTVSNIEIWFTSKSRSYTTEMIKSDSYLNLQP